MPTPASLQVYRDSPDYEVVGIVEPDEELRNRAADLGGLSRSAVDDPRSNCSTCPVCRRCWSKRRVRDLLDTAEACIAAGKHIHLDKPAGESLPQYRRILDAAEKQKLLVQMGYMFRYNPAVVLLREFLNEGLARATCSRSTR